MVKLTNRNKQDLLEQLKELKTELASLRVNKVTGGNASKLTKMYVASIRLEVLRMLSLRARMDYRGLSVNGRRVAGWRSGAVLSSRRDIMGLGMQVAWRHYGRNIWEWAVHMESGA